MHTQTGPGDNSSNIAGGGALHAAAFDELASDYDATFASTPVGSALRALVWARCDRVFAHARRVIDLGCGTGEDALRLASPSRQVVAIDSAPGMVRIAEEKSRRRGCAAWIDFHCLPVEQLGSALPDKAFDGVLSNFGALNCVADLPALVSDVAARLAPGARLLWVLMGRHVPWEWAWFLMRTDSAKAWRRLGGTSGWRGIQVSYPTPRELSGMLQPFFRIDALRPLGFALPPSYAAGWLNRRPRVLSVFTRIERLAQGWPMLASCADHYILEATRLPVTADR